MSSTQPIIMAHHPQIAYAAQQTANQFAQRFSTNNHNDATKNSTPTELQNNNSNMINQNINQIQPSLQQQIPMYYPNIIYAGGQKQPHQTFVQVSPPKKNIEESSSSRSSSPKNSSCHGNTSDNENSATSSLPENMSSSLSSSSPPPPLSQLQQPANFYQCPMMPMHPYVNFNPASILGGGTMMNMMKNVGMTPSTMTPMISPNMNILNQNLLESENNNNFLKLGNDPSSIIDPMSMSGTDNLSSKGSTKNSSVKNSESVSPDCSASNGSAPTSSNGSSKKQKPQKPVKKVIVINLPSDMQTIESVTSRFHQYGEILLVRVLKPGKILPFDLKQFASKIHDLGTTPCAIIEFEQASSAKSTVEKEKENLLRLALLQPGADIELYGPSSEIHSDHSSHQPNSTPRGSLVGSDLPISSHHNESGIDVISNNSEHSGESMNKDNSKDDQTRKSSRGSSSDTRKNSDSRKSSENKTNKNAGTKADKRGGANHHQSKADNLGKLPVTAPKNQAVKTKRSQSVPYLPQQQQNNLLPLQPQFSQPAHRICGWPINFTMQNQIPQLIPGTIITPQFIPIPTTTTTNPAGQLQAQIAVAAATAAANAVGNNNKEQQQQQHSAHMNLAAPEFIPKSTNSVTTNPLLVPTITNIPNGRVLTSMNIRLNPSQTKNTHRNTKKLDLTGRRHTIAPQDPVKFDVKIDNQPRTLSSSPNSENNENNNNNNNSKPMRVQKYSRNYLMSLKESKMSLQLPNLPNIPELLPTSKTPVFNGHKQHQNNNNHGNNHSQNQYKYRGRYNLQQK